MITRADQIRDALSALQPVHLEVIDESHMHSRGLETHYKAVIVSAQFEGRRAIQRHQARLPHLPRHADIAAVILADLHVDDRILQEIALHQPAADFIRQGDHRLALCLHLADQRQVEITRMRAQERIAK